MTIEGKQMLKESELSTDNIEIPVANINIGTYLLRITDIHNNITIKRIVKL